MDSFKIVVRSDIDSLNFGNYNDFISIIMGIVYQLSLNLFILRIII